MKILRYAVLMICIFIVSGYTKDLNTTVPDIKENIIFLSYEKKPDRIYVNQIFKIKIKAVIARNDFDRITTSFQNGKDIKVLNPKNSWKWFNDNIYFIEYYLKVTTSEANLPDVGISVYKGSNLLAFKTLKSFKPEIIELKKNEIFSGVIAKKLRVIKSKTTKFDKKSNILVMEIEALQGNLRDFNIQSTIKNGIDSFKENLPYSKIFYFAIVPNTQKEFKFSYFNVDKNKFENFIIPLEVISEDTSTQLELNPKESKVSMYKNIILTGIAFLSLILFFFRRKIVYIIIFIGIAVYLFIFYNPFDSIIVPKNTKIRILPTYNSTIFYITDRKIVAEKLNTTKEYIKILLPNGKIGWIKKGANIE
jgi:hypothetical protein